MSEKGRSCGCKHAGQAPVYTGDDTASIHEATAPVYTGDDLASIYGEENPTYIDSRIDCEYRYNDDDTVSSKSSGRDDRDDRPLEKRSRNEREARPRDERKINKYMMTKKERKYMTRNSAGCLVATLCVAMLILVLATMALFIWLFIFELPGDKGFNGYCPAVGRNSSGICIQECNNNSTDCKGNKLCCFNGCGYVCVDPAPVVINLNVTLDQLYDPAYRDPMSAEYRSLERDYIIIIDDVVGKDDKLGKFYIETTVSELRRGSVVIVSWLSFNANVSEVVDIQNKLQQEINALLSNETNDGRLGRLEGAVLDVAVSGPIGPADRPGTGPPPTRGPPSPPNTDEPPRLEDPLGTGICGTRPGVSGPQSRIVGSEDANIESLPWIGSVWNEDGEYIAAATLLNQQWAITEARVVNSNPSHVAFGLEDLTGGFGRDGIPISVFIPHPSLRFGLDLNHNIALIKLARPVRFSNQVRPACFGTSTYESSAYRTCRTAGFGAQSFGDFGSANQLRQAENVAVHSSQTCQNIYATNDYNPEIENNQICAGELDNGDGNGCWGDAGIPLLCLGYDDLWHLVGVSAGITCDTPDLPTPYSRISSYRDFILDAITSTESCLGFNTQECTYPCAGIGIDCVRPRCNDPDLFQCDLGPCIPVRYVCNERFDCLDDSDEANCDVCGEPYISVNSGESYDLSFPVYAPFASSPDECKWEVTANDGRLIQIVFVDVSIEQRDVLTINVGDRTLVFDGVNDDLSGLLSSEPTVEIKFQPSSQNSRSAFRLKLSDYDPASGCSFGQFQCSYATLFCIDTDHLCNGAINCPNGDDEENCPNDCGEEKVLIYPGDTYRLTSANHPGLYPDDSFCSWIIETHPRRHLLLHFTAFSLQNGDYLSINLDGVPFIQERKRRQVEGPVEGPVGPPVGPPSHNYINFTGRVIPGDLLSSGPIVSVSMTTNGLGRDYGFVLEISDTDGSGVTACMDGSVIPPDMICNDIVDCPDNSDEAPCQCGDLPDEMNMQSTDAITLTSLNYPFQEYPNSLNCHWIFSVNPGYRVFVHFNAFSLQTNFDFLTITGTNQMYPSVAYTGSSFTLPPDIESPSNFLFIRFQTDATTGDLGFSLTASVTQAIGRKKCDNQLELLPDGNICDGVQHCYDGSDEPEGCECGEEDEFNLTPGDEPLFLASANYPLNYLPNTNCQYTIRTFPGYRILAKFVNLNLELYFDFVNIDAIGGDKVPYTTYTGSISHTERALDAISASNIMRISFETDFGTQETGYKIQLTSVSGDYTDGRRLCDNKVQILPEEFVCDMLADCHDRSDENTCVDIFETEICGTRPVVDDLRILFGDDAKEGEFPWTGLLDYEYTCSATLLNEYWAVTAAHCLEDLPGDQEIKVVFGDLNGKNPSSPHRQEVEMSMYFLHETYNFPYDDIALIRFKLPVKFTNYVRPACVAANRDETDYYRQCKFAGWGDAERPDSTRYLPSELQTQGLSLLPIDQCGMEWAYESDSSLLFTSADWQGDDWPLLCAMGNENFADTCSGDSGGGMTCLGGDGRWHLVGILSGGSVNCKGLPAFYTRVSTYRQYLVDTIQKTESCLSATDENPACRQYCIYGPDCPLSVCNEDQFRCENGRGCIPLEDVCNGVADCGDESDESVPYCFNECGRSDIAIFEYSTYTLTSPNYPGVYPDNYNCHWTVTSPPNTRIFAEFANFDLEEYYDFVTVGYEPNYREFGGDSERYAPHFFSGQTLPSSFLSPHNVFYVTMESDLNTAFQGFALKFHVYTVFSDIPPLCGDNFQVFNGVPVVCDGVPDCIDGTDEAPCICPAVETYTIVPGAPTFISSPGFPLPYSNSLSCTWVVTSRHYIYTDMTYFRLDVYTDTVQVSSRTGVEGVTSYVGGSENGYLLYFKTNEVVVHFQTDSFWNRQTAGFEMSVYETNGDDCIFSTDPTCTQRPGCGEDCYTKKCSSGLEVYPASWFCDGYFDCSDESDEPEYCECGEREIYIPSDGSYELSSPPSVLLPGTYRLDSNCQWTFTTSPGYVLYAHFNSFNIEDGKPYIAYDDLLYGDYLYAGIGSSAVNYRRVTYTGSDVPLDLETSGSRLVLTFVTDETIAFDGFSVVINSRRPAAEMKCENGLEVIPRLLRCNGTPDCHGEPTDEANCGNR